MLSLTRNTSSCGVVDKGGTCRVMEIREFDRLTKVIGQSASRRASLGAALAALLTLGGGETLAKKQSKRKARREPVRAAACIPTGQPCPSKKPRGHNKHGKARTLSCNRCCQGHTAVVNGVTTCACQPDTLACTTNSECCAGVCLNGSCVATTSPPPPPCTGPALGEACTTSGTPCCTNVNPNAQCGGGFAANATCQDCASPPTAAGAFCRDPLGNQCCGGSPTCFVGVRVQDGQPTCLSDGACPITPCTGDGPAGGCSNPLEPICIQNNSTAPLPAGCCPGGLTTICASPCPAG
jgi:hypothetical protein